MPITKPNMTDREREFKAWDNHQKEWSFVVNLHFEKDGTWNWNADHVDPDSGDTICFFDKGTGVLVEWTGQVINGVKVYGGDVMRNEEDLDPEDDDLRYYLVCTWIKEWSMFAFLRTEDEYQEYQESGAEALDSNSYWTFPVKSHVDQRLKIVGNIAEKPELLNL